MLSRRAWMEIGLGVLLAAGFFYWLYLRPEGGKEIVDPKGPEVQQSLAANQGKVLLIGVEGLTWSVTLDLINQGRLPNLSRLFQKGAHGIMKPMPPLLANAAWTSIVTGQPASVHGLSQVAFKFPFQYRETRADLRFRKVPTVWDMAAGMGKRVAVVNWNSAGRAEPLADGVFVAEGALPAKVKEETVWPPSWLEKLSTIPTPRHLPVEENLGRAGDRRAQLAYELDRAVFVAGLEILREARPDLCLIYFPGLELVSLSFFKYRWPAGLDHFETVSEDDRKRYGGLLESHYELVDRLIGGLLSEADGYVVMVVSDYGFGPAAPPNNLFLKLNHLLERLGHLNYQGSRFGATCDEILTGLIKSGELNLPPPRTAKVFALCRELIQESGTWLARGEPRMPPAAVDGFIAAHYQFKAPATAAEEKEREMIMAALADLLLPEHQRQDIHWAKTMAWNPRDSRQEVQGIYLNVKGREPEGILPAEDYEKQRKKLARQLRALRTENGLPVFRSVRPNPEKELWPVEALDAPDLLVEVNPKALTEEYIFRVPHDPDPLPLAAVRAAFADISASPLPEGVFIISGEPARNFRRLDISPLDVVPTILWWLGLPLAANLPGQARREIFISPLSERPELYISSYSGQMSPPPNPPAVPPPGKKK